MSWGWAALPSGHVVVWTQQADLSDRLLRLTFPLCTAISMLICTALSRRLGWTPGGWAGWAILGLLVSGVAQLLAHVLWTALSLGWVVAPVIWSVVAGPSAAPDSAQAFGAVVSVHVDPFPSLVALLAGAALFMWLARRRYTPPHD